MKKVGIVMGSDGDFADCWKRLRSFWMSWE